LRERREDILPLSETFIKRICAEAKKRPKALSPAAQEALLAHGWPGNIREMRNAIERAVIFASGPELTPVDLGLGRLPPKGQGAFPCQTLNLKALERQAIETALQRSGWVQRKAAQLLGISPRALSYKLDKLGFAAPELSARRRR
jgi:DNA-binding NtrC family response regulator